MDDGSPPPSYEAHCIIADKTRGEFLQPAWEPEIFENWRPYNDSTIL